MTYRVSLTLAAQADLLRLYDYLLQRELDRPGGGDLEIGEKALAAIQDGLATLRRSPFTCRKAAESPFLRELLIPFGATGYVALFEIAGPDKVVIAAVRHQREDDYH
jgi:plasmid stabilization system protein ParE